MNIRFHLITKHKLLKIRHRGCGNHVAYVKDASKSKRDVNNFYFLDGSHPIGTDKIDVYCDKCGAHINRLADLVL